MAGLGRQQFGVDGLGIARHGMAGCSLQSLGGAEAEVLGLDPLAVHIAEGGVIDLVHARVEHGLDLGAAMQMTGLFGHCEQRVHGQHGNLGGKRQTLGDGAGRAQAREGAGAAPEGNGVQLRETQPRILHELAYGRQQLGRRLLRARSAVLPDGIATLDGYKQGIGTGVDGEKIHVRRGVSRRRAGAQYGLQQTAA